MPLAHEHAAAHPKQACYDLSPAADAGKPTNCPDARVDEIEAMPSEQLNRVVDITLGEGHFGSSSFGKFTCGLQGGRREVQTDHRLCPQPPQRHCVGADMALQMHHIKAIEAPQPRQVVSHHRRQVVGVVEAGEVVSSRPGMHRHPRLPVRKIDVPPVCSHRPTIAPRGEDHDEFRRSASSA